MRHRVVDKKFNRDANHRKALFKNLVMALFEHGAIETTQAKAKAVRPIAEKLITRAKKATLADRRLLHRFFGKRAVVNTLVDSVAPALHDRTSGFTRIVVVGNRRGDNTPLVKLSLLTPPLTLGFSRPAQATSTPATSSVTAAVKPSAKKAKPTTKKAKETKKKVAAPSTKKATQAKK